MPSGDLDITNDSHALAVKIMYGDEDSKSVEEWVVPPKAVASFSIPPHQREFSGNILKSCLSDNLLKDRTEHSQHRMLMALNSMRAQRKSPSKPFNNKNLRVRFNLQTDTEAASVVLSPEDPQLERWRSFGVIFLSISFFRLPMVIAFGTHGIVWDVIPDAYFFLDNCLMLNTALYHNNRLLTSRSDIFMAYISPAHFFSGERTSIYVFLMEFIPFYAYYAASFYIELPFWLLSIACLFRGRRIYDLLRFFYERERDLTKDVRLTAVFKYALAMLGCGHWFACFWWLLARVSRFSPQCWLQQYLSTYHMAYDLEEGGSLYSYSVSLLWGYSTLSGIGYMNYLPTTTLESFFFVAFTFASVVVHSFLFGILLHYIVRKDVAQEKYKSMMEKVEKYSSLYGLPRKLEDAIKLFYTFQHRKKVGSDEEELVDDLCMADNVLVDWLIWAGWSICVAQWQVMKVIPKHLKMKIMVHQYHLVASDRIFHACPEQFVSTVLSLLKPKILIPGTQIYLKDDASREVCFLERGEVEIYDAEEVFVGTLKATEDRFPAIGEIAFFLGVPQVYTFTATKSSEVKLLTLSKEDYEGVKDRFPDARDILINNVRGLLLLGKDDDEVDSIVDSQGDNNSMAELRKRVQEALRTKLDQDVATVFNAIRDGYLDEVKLLLSKGFNPNATDYDKRTSLHFAAVAGDDKVVDLLLQHGADVHMRDRWGRNAFQDAVDHNHRKVIQQLAAQGAELHLENAAGRLCSAAFADNLFELQHLVENGIDANSADYDGRTALHLSACEGNSKIVEFLLLPMSKGDPNVTDRWGTSPLLDAIRHGNQAVAHILYENGARLAIERAATFLCMAAAEGDCPMLRLLSECGVDTNIGDYDNRYPIHLAAAEGEVVSVHFLTYAHADISVKDRWGRTPLDDALTGKYWCCAKLLFGFGAEHTIDITPEARAEVDAIPVDDIRECVMAEKVLQESRKDTEKHLRDNVKWMMADAETWVNSLAQRLRQLDRAVEKYMHIMEDEESCSREAGQFMDQPDDDILEAETRPVDRAQRPGVSRANEAGADFLLTRFFNDSRPSPWALTGVKTLKSMQHFFLKLSMMERSLSNFKARVRQKGSSGTTHRAKINHIQLVDILNDYGFVVNEEEAYKMVQACSERRKHGDSRHGYEEYDEEDEEVKSEHQAGRLVNFEELLTSLPLWKAVAEASAPQYEPFEKDAQELQETVQCIFQGFCLIDSNGNGRLSRTEWRLHKRHEDLGDFATAVDKFMEEREVMTLEIFFLAVAYWAGLDDTESDYSDDEDEGVYAWLNEPVADVIEEGGSEFYGSVASNHRDNGGGRESDEEDAVDGTEGSPCRVEGPKVPPCLEAAIEFKREIVSFPDMADQPNPRFQDVSIFTRLTLWMRFKMIEQRLARRVSGGIMASSEDIQNRFARLDVMGKGALDETKAQLLLSWAFDVDLKLKDWDAIFFRLAGPESCLVQRDAILRWTDSLIRRHSRKSPSWHAIFLSFIAWVKATAIHLASVPLIFDHEGPFTRVWRVVNFMTALYTFVSVPYQIAFLRHELLGRYFSSLAASWAFDVLMLLDILVHFNTSFTDERSIKVYDRHRIRSRYLQSDFVMDFIGIVPLDVLAAYYGRSQGDTVAWLRVLKLCHTYKFYNQMRYEISDRSSAVTRLMADIQSLYCISMVMIHLLACTWYYMTEGQGFYEKVYDFNFLGAETHQDDDGGPFAIRYYFYSASLVVFVVAVNGLPGVSSGHTHEVWFFILCIILNLSFWSYLMGSISGLFVSMDESVAQSHEQMGSCVRFIKQNNIPSELGVELKDFFSMDMNQKCSLSLADQNLVYRNLPLSIQVELARHISRDLLVQVEIFRNTSDHFLDAVSTLLQVEVVAGGEYLYKEGSVCRTLIIIASGIVETVTLDTNTQQWAVQGTHEAGEALGQLEFCLDTRYMTSARVASGGDVLRVFRLQKEDFTRVLKLYPKDEDVIHQNLAGIHEDETKIETASQARSMHSAISHSSLESGLRTIMDDGQLERAMQDIDKAKGRSQEQRIRSFCNAAALGNTHVLARLINSAVDVNGRDANGRTALMLATCSGNLPVVQYLVSKGSDPNLKDNFGGSALLDAMKGNHSEIMAYLKKRGAVLQLDDEAGTLCQVAADGKTDQLRRLLSLGANPNVSDYDKRTPLHTAASEGHLECVKLLLEYWAEVNPLDRFKGTPLTDSVRHGHFEVQKYLRERGGKLIIDPIELGTTLCEAAATGDLHKIQILDENGGDINQALHLAACCNKLSVMEYLVNIPGININPLDRLCCTPLDDAIREKQGHIATVLMTMGGLRGQDPQLEAARMEHKRAREYAISQKALRREKKMALFELQTGVLARILDIYKNMSESLPLLCKYLNLLSVTLRTRRNTSVVDRTPRPSTSEVRKYFSISLHIYIERRYLEDYDGFLTLCEEYAAQEFFADRVVTVEKIMQKFLDASSPDLIQINPSLVRAFRDRYKTAMHDGDLPNDLFEDMTVFVLAKLEGILPDYFVSREFYVACRKQNGFLWRVIKLSRLIYGLSGDILEKVINPLLDIGDKDEWGCVPHITQNHHDKFRTMCVQYKVDLERLQKSIHIIGYLVKEHCMRETLRESHASQLVAKQGARDRPTEVYKGLNMKIKG